MDAKLSHFTSFEDQESKDLAYGQQAPLCEKYSAEKAQWQDASMSGDWLPEED